MRRGFKSNGSGGSNMAYISDTVARIKRQRIELRRDFQVVLDNLDDEAAELEDLALQCEKLMSRNLTM
jgi:hypothetical protein